MVQVILVRHGETDWNEAHRIQGGNSDTPLNERGREQAERLGLRLKQERIRAIYASSLKRALDTALVIAHHHQLEVQIEPSLREINVGELEGISISVLGKRLDELLAAQNQIPAGVGGDLWSKLKYIGGESLDELQQRAWGAMQRIVNQYSEGVIVVVSHYFVVLAIICAVLNLPVSQIGRLRLGVGGISTIVFDGQVTRLTQFNDSCHLTI